MKYFFLLIPVLFFQIFACGQNKAGSLNTLTKIDLGLPGLGLTYEPRLSNMLTSDLSVGVGGGYSIGDGSLVYSVFKPALHFSVTPKLYYNIKRKLEKGKSIVNNSGDYFGVRIKYSMPLSNKTNTIRNSILTNFHWGLQRPIGKHWTFNSLIGLGYARDIEYGFGTIYPALDFKFSYIL